MSEPKPTLLDDHSIATVASISRAMYPHDALPDEVYVRVAGKLAAAAAEDAATAKLISTALTTLANDDLLSMSEQTRLDTVESTAGTEFFQLVRSVAVAEVYSDPRTWEICGYEGPSFDQGGYLNRGFNDLAWLPDPEDEQ